jgi:thiol-disulfide isomerase/thioredoxin
MNSGNEGRAVRAVGCLCVAACCLLGLGGCSLFGKKSQTRDNPRPAAPPAGADFAPPAPTPSGVADRAPPPDVNGLLAGRVVDSYDRPPPPTFIQVVSAQEGPNSKGAPIEAAADSMGFFMIRGLQPGQHYQLIARTRNGEAKLAGSAWATPPNPRVLIHISQDFYTPNTPAAPAPPAVPGQKATPGGTPAPNWPGKTGDKGANDPAKRAADIGTPRKADDGAPPASAIPAQPRAEVRPQDMVDSGQVAAAPVVDIPGPGGGGRAVASTAPSYTAAIPAVATRVPSCVLTGRQLENFALYDLNAQPWEFRNQRRGRLVLLDFWGTWCVPCRQAIFHLKALQENYGRFGLEVIGIAYEEGPLQDQIRKVQGVRDRMGMNYRLLLGSGMGNCPVKTQFGITQFPTLVLLDEGSRIIWRQEGIDPYRLQELDMIIRQRLQIR